MTVAMPPRFPRRHARSKLLKAVAVRAATKVAPADPPAVLAAARDLRARSFGPATAKYRELGTLANLLAFNAIATLPTRNFQASTFAEAPRLSAEDLAERAAVLAQQLPACAIGCEPSTRGRGSRSRRYRRLALGRCAGFSSRTPSSEGTAAATSWPRHDLGGGTTPGRWSASSAA